MRIVPVGAESFGANTYLIVSKNEALVVDPALTASAILEAVRAEDAHPVGILLTHGHFDHMLGMDTLRATYPLEVYLHEEDAEMLSDGKKNAFSLFFHKDRSFGEADRLLRDGDEIPLGEEFVRVIHTPGHTKGSVCYVFDGMMFTGDTLFKNSIGRTDLGGDEEAMMRSLRALRNLPGDYDIYPGHDKPTTLDDERRYNPYLKKA